MPEDDVEIRLIFLKKEGMCYPVEGAGVTVKHRLRNYQL
jgi:hypothetical protein